VRWRRAALIALQVVGWVVAVAAMAWVAMMIAVPGR